MNDGPRDEDAVRHPDSCEYCGNYRGASGPYEHHLYTLRGHILKACYECAQKFDPRWVRMVERVL